MSRGAKRHTHKYYKKTLSFGQVWACALPTCNHYMPTHMTELLPGKQSVCWECEGMLVLNELNMKMEKPLCEDCSGTADLAAFINQRLREGNKTE